MDKPKILVVDDEESIRHALNSLLKRRGCEVRCAETAERAAEVLDEFEPNVVLTDMVLPGANGLRVISRVRQTYPETVVIMMTSQESTDLTLRALRLGASDYLQKPFEGLDQIWSCVQRALEKNREAIEMRAILS